MKFTTTAVLAASAMALTVPSAASAQDLNDADGVTTTVPVSQDDGDDFPWGLLGLLGLAGLAGLKRRDDNVRVDRGDNVNRPR